MLIYRVTTEGVVKWFANERQAVRETRQLPQKVYVPTERYSLVEWLNV